MKTKPSQQSVGILRTIGIIPDILICRCEHPMTAEHKAKLALFCDVDENKVIEEKDVDHSIYEVPLELARQDVDVYIMEMLGLHVNPLDISEWKAMVDTLITPPQGTVEIAVVGKYIGLRDSYKSIYESLTHGGIANKVKVKIRMVESEDVEKSGAAALLDGVCGVLIPGGFGDRGIEGKIQAIRYARENNIPFFGICLGMQCATIEYARNVCGMADASSTEFAANTAYPVIDMMIEQKKVTEKGGTMRLGAYPCQITEGTEAHRLYGQVTIQERHRHRYEFNNKYREKMQKSGMIFSGLCPGRDLVEIIELKDHPWFVACQFHPEFQSTPLRAHPLFRGFVEAAVRQRGKGESKKHKRGGRPGKEM
jgi:CTP synthase